MTMDRVTHADSPFDAKQEARIYTIANLVARGMLEELGSRGGLPAIAGQVLQAMEDRDFGQTQIARFPHQEDVNAG